MNKQAKQHNQLSLSLPHQDDCKTRMAKSNAQQNIEQLQNPTMGVTINRQHRRSICLSKQCRPNGMLHHAALHMGLPCLLKYALSSNLYIKD